MSVNQKNTTLITGQLRDKERYVQRSSENPPLGNLTYHTYMILLCRYAFDDGKFETNSERYNYV